MFENNEQALHNQHFCIRQIPELNRKIQYILEQIKKPLNYILPRDFDKKIDRCRSSQEKWTKEKLQEYSDVISFLIEGTINVSLIILGQKFTKEFGAKSFFWIEVISDFAVCQKYDESLKMWHIRDSLKTTLHLPAEQYEKLRKFQKMARAHITVIKSLIKAMEQYQRVIKSTKIIQNNNESEQEKIQEKTQNQNEQNQQKAQKLQKFTPQRILKQIQQVQSKYIEHDKKFTQFIKNQYKQITDLNFLSEKMNINQLYTSQANNSNSKTNNYLSFNNNSKSRSKKLKTKNQPVQQQKFITQFIDDNSRENKHNKEKQNFLNKIKGCHAFPPIQKNILSTDNIKKLIQTFANIGNNCQEMSTLRQQYFKKSRLRLQKPKRPHFVNINCEFSYFRYEIFFVNDEELFTHEKINFSQPLKQYNLVVYEVDSEVQFDELLGDDLQMIQSDDYSSVQSISDVDFIDNQQLQEFKCQVAFRPKFDNQRFKFNQKEHMIQITSKQQQVVLNPNNNNNRPSTQEKQKKSKQLQNLDHTFYEKQQDQKRRLNSLSFQEQFSIICLQTKLPIMSADQTEKQQFYQAMCKIVHGKSWKEIQQNFNSFKFQNNNRDKDNPSQQDQSKKQKYKLKHLHEFIKDHTVRKMTNVQGKKVYIFYVKELFEQQPNKKFITTDKSSQSYQQSENRSKQLFHIMKKIVHGYNWNEIMQNFEAYIANYEKDAQKLDKKERAKKYSKKDLDYFMKDHSYKTVVIVNGKRVNYFYVKENVNENKRAKNLMPIQKEKNNNLASQKNNKFQIQQQETKFEDIPSFNDSNTYQKTKRVSQNSSVSRHSNFQNMVKSDQNLTKSQRSSLKMKNSLQKDEEEQFQCKEISKSRKIVLNINPDSQQTRRSRRIQQMQKIDYSKFQKIQELDI